MAFSDSFFARPAGIGLMTWFGSTFILLFPTGFILTPKGETKTDSQDEFDAAQNAYNTAEGQFNSAQMQLNEANQRVRDITCAMNGYMTFNQQVFALKARLDNVSLSNPLDFLSNQFFLNFVPDRTDTKQNVVSKTYREAVQEYLYSYTCRIGLCSNSNSNSNCCYAYNWQTVYKTRYYNEITYSREEFRNILMGSGLQLVPLNCGFYSRSFSLNAPFNYVIRENMNSGGDMRAGSVYVNVDRTYGSKVPAVYTLDGATVNNPITVPDSTQTQSANSVALQLMQFLATAIAAFNATGGNYPALQSSIQNQIPSLERSFASANMTFFTQTQLLADKKAVLDNAGSDFSTNLSIWLPVLFVIPVFLGFVACLGAWKYQNKGEETSCSSGSCCPC